MSESETARPDGTPSIVVVIALYNGAGFIEETIGGVLAQTVVPDEFVVVDDGSVDGGAEIVERAARDLPVTVIRTPNRGQSAARNVGVGASRSDLIAFLDHDDIWRPDHLELLREPFLRDREPPLGWTYSNVDEMDEGGRTVTRGLLRQYRAQHPKMSLSECLGGDMYVLPSASLISRTAFEAIGGFDERLIGYEDDDLFLRMFQHGFGNVYIDKPLSQWRIHLGSSAHSPRMARSRMIFFEKLAGQFPKEKTDPDGKSYLRDLIAPRMLRHIGSDFVHSVEADDRSGARRSRADISVVRPHLNRKLKVLVALAWPVLSIHGLSRLAVRLNLTPTARQLFRSES
ncbi:glycosyltransferase family A protein [Antrihabitans sp. YC2-6]|uniref:glycosyltransferase family 2 protein n=1 Tax=Antrihabitans sp. YC2-6 TaxID=2799498 RepID=UPI0018F5EEFA|nr:glycosyltransferase family A protein [Antrihabitans sp. YC2-6]MBJ8348700.1 glycosyltransferase family 2 protein [Antrihabitans sp. YC2-6]